jgi:hypothetical protein
VQGAERLVKTDDVEDRRAVDHLHFGVCGSGR